MLIKRAHLDGSSQRLARARHRSEGLDAVLAELDQGRYRIARRVVGPDPIARQHRILAFDRRHLAALVEHLDEVAVRPQTEV